MTDGGKNRNRRSFLIENEETGWQKATKTTAQHLA
jgi:hypothetical protein